MTPESFAALCFVCIINHHGNGWLQLAHPDYVEEKRIAMLNAGFDAYAFLDRENQLAIIGYFKYWKLELPDSVKSYEKELRKLVEKDEDLTEIVERGLKKRGLDWRNLLK